MQNLIFGIIIKHMEQLDKCDTILELLKRENHFVNGTLIAEQLNTSRVTVSNWVRKLVLQGYDIISVTNRGYKLVSCPDILSRIELAEYLTRPNAENVVCLPVIDSTNDYLKKLAVEGAKEGTVVVADEQTAGKGRTGKKFYSPKNTGIYLSYLYRPTLGLKDLSTLTGKVAIAVLKAIKTVCGVELDIKWVNDLLLNGKKVCGILTELSVFGENMNAEFAVVGIGINVNNPKSEFSGELSEIATSLFAELDRKFERKRIVAEIINNLDLLFTEYTSQTIDYYRSRCVNINKEVSFTYNNTPMSGVVLGIDNNLSLIVDVDGEIMTLSSGEVSIKNVEG